MLASRWNEEDGGDDRGNEKDESANADTMYFHLGWKCSVLCIMLRLAIQFPASRHCQNKRNKILKKDELPTLLVKDRGEQGDKKQSSWHDCDTEHQYYFW